MLYKQKQRRKWWIYPKEETLAQQEARTEEDPWTVKVHAYLQGRAELPDTTGLLTHVLDVPTGRQMKGQQTRLGQILRKLGCEQLARCRRDGKRVRPWKVPDELARAPMLIPPPLTFPTPVQLAPAMQPLPPASNGDLA